MHKMLGSRFHSGTYGTNGWLCAPFNYSQQSMAVLYYDPLVKEVLGTCYSRSAFDVWALSPQLKNIT